MLSLDGTHILQIWRLAVNILSKKLQTADKGLSFSLGLGQELRTSNHKYQYVTKCYTGPWT